MKSSSPAVNRPPPARFTTSRPLPPDIPTAAADIYEALLARFGPQHWWPGDSPLEIAVGAVLTQNTAWTNVERAIANLKAKRLLDLDRLAALPPSRLAPLIRSAGFHNLKARRLHALLGWLRDSGGFAGLRLIRTGELRRRLLAINGIGPETADSILLYALGRPSFVIDAYTRRILHRYGLIKGNEPYDELKALFERSLPRSARRYNEYHALIVRLAKTHCRATPVCTGCPLA